LRLFFALQPTAETASSVLEAATTLLSELQVPAVPASNLHATLCFLGEVAPERLEDLRAVAAGVRGAPIELNFDVFDFWEQPRVLVAGVTIESMAANALSTALHGATISAGFTPDSKPLRAHLTLARKILRADAQKILWPQKISPGFVVRADNFVLMESRKAEQGSIYSAVDSWPLYEKEDSRITQ
jgi:RNA 2',3'-cyclic 3'-phosphodiesterase